MEINEQIESVVLETAKELQALTRGAELGGITLSPILQCEIAIAEQERQPHQHQSGELNFTATEAKQPRIHIGPYDFSQVVGVCEATLDADGWQGVVYRLRGYKKAARSIIQGINKLSNPQYV